MACVGLLVMSVLWNGALGAPEDNTLTAPRNVTAQEGLCVLISCRFTIEKPLFGGSTRGYWFIQGDHWEGPAVASNDGNREIRADTRGRFRLVGDLMGRDCSFSINDVRRSDGGSYYFRYEHGGFLPMKFSYAQFPVRLTVVGLRDQPEISLRDPVIEGEMETVVCTAPGRCSGTAPKITWSPEYYPSVHNTHNPDGTITYGSTISFPASRDQNIKRLSCSVYFPAVGAFSSRSVRLNVEYAPAAPEIILYHTEGATHRLIASSMVMQEGFDYTLVCTVDSNPLSKLTWKKSENILEESASSSNTLLLTLRKVSSSDDGDYYCLATNKHGSRITFITAHVEYSPRTPKMNDEGVTIPDSPRTPKLNDEDVMIPDSPRTPELNEEDVMLSDPSDEPEIFMHETLGDSRVAIIGIVGASILLLALLVGVSLCVTRKIRKRGNTGNRNMNMASNDTTVDPTYQELQPRQSDTYSELKRDGK